MTPQLEWVRDGSWIQTYSGKKFWPLDPKAVDIDIVDIAHALSNLCRFTGHIHKFYSVAEHSVRVAWLCPKPLALYGLLHDGSEYALSDISTPVKTSKDLAGYRVAESRLQARIYERFNLIPPNDVIEHVVKLADRRMLATEARDLLGPLHPDWHLEAEPVPSKITPWRPEQAKRIFLDLFEELTRTK